MAEFYVVCYPGAWHEFTSKVYAIECNRELFLVADKNDEFEWVDFKDCRLTTKEVRE